MLSSELYGKERNGEAAADNTHVELQSWWRKKLNPNWKFEAGVALKANE